ncbi:AraC family transcriptional regulator [Paractinoplanes rishiriensis]|uniref:AraC family transcriptional regulator n=1 Tax=Paractinoplanes rishiriensis TaxID=1050105 RepID=A0A919JSE2_9ACTN|nr:AraC family transcriptional regulator [Actinoplanes rishiriensis]GIE92579.1 AraC family transcriptional regulator [Actinoplanes rishiriensis]
MPQDIQRFHYATRDFESAHAVLGDLYVGHDVRVRGPVRDFEYRQEAVSTDAIAVGRVRYQMATDMLAEPVDRLLAGSLTAGRLEARAGRETHGIGPGEVFLNRIGPALATYCEHIDLVTVSVDLELTAGVAAARTGVAPDEFRFEGMAPVSAVMNRYWRETTVYLYELFTGPEAPLRSPLVVRSAAELAAAAAIVAFPNTSTAASYLPGPGQAAPSSVRRALAYIESHAGDPITAAQVAAAARVSPRAIQAAFRRHLGTTPSGHLRRVRLDRAHRDLQAADPTRGDTVVAIANRWGWASRSRFTADYRSAYGHPPDRTLST